MNQRLLFMAMLVLPLTLGGCFSSGGSSSSSAASADDTTNDDTTNDDTTAGATAAPPALSGSGVSDSVPPTGSTDVPVLEVPEEINVVTAGSGNNGNSLNVKSWGRLFNDAGTQYTLADQRAYIWLPALEPIDTVNGILCFLDQFGIEAMINRPPYRVLANEDRCFQDSGDTEANSDGAAVQGAASTDGDEAAPDLREVVVHVARLDENSPMIVHAWMPEMGDDDFNQAIRIKAIMSEGVSADKPFGTFAMSFGMSASSDPNVEDIVVTGPDSFMGGGVLGTIGGLPAGQAGFTLFETGTFTTPDESFSRTWSQNAAVVMNGDGTSGRATTGFSEEEGGAHGQFSETGSFDLAFNDSHVLLNTGAETRCLDRTAFNEVVWRYDLYNADTGTQAQLNSGFPFKWDTNSDSVRDGFGFVGFWGVWTENGQSVPDGTVIEKETFNNTAGATYTIKSAPGRLIKKEVKTVDILTKMIGVEMFTSDFQIQGCQPTGEANTQCIVKFQGADQASIQLVKVGTITWSQNGEVRENLPTPEVIASYDPQGFNFFWMWSDQLGGGVNWSNNKDKVVFFQETEVDADDPLFNGSDTAVTLHCLERCPKAGIVAADLGTFDGPFNPEPNRDTQGQESIKDSFQYSIARTDLALKNGSTNVGFADSVTRDDLEGTQYHFGIRSGPMVDAATYADMTNWWEVWNFDRGYTIYEYETGLEQWNRRTFLLDSSNAVVKFDRPWKFTYDHTTAADRNGDASNDGRTFLLEYGGNGDLWGIPSRANEDKERYYPLFSIADGTLVTVNVNGTDTEFAVKARELEQKMSKVDPTQCGALSLATPVGTTAPTSVDRNTFNMIPMPVVTDAPVFVDGEAAQE